MSEGNQHHPRTRILVDRKFQLKYLMIWMLTAFGALAIGVSFFLIYAKIKGMDVNPAERELLTITLRTLIGSAALVLLFALALGLYATYDTHRVAGAAFRIETDLERILNGEKEVEIRVREKDYLQNLAQRANELNQRFQLQQDVIRGLVGKLEGLKDEPGESRLNVVIAEIRETLVEKEENEA